jgi:predicted DNA-binding protein
MAAKKTLSFKARLELRKAFEKEAKKDNRTLSYYIEQICEDFASNNNIIKKVK